ncbi:DinB superfamily protein [Dyadobacter soli]|uniref:DinB superfamily protein n=1 Tax=Dyadobacter soli TaxID=659014 RepID=A0A1G6VZZ1_9BACT|nr:DinB family protein [Dyadobacter soli]SDD59129.1 DinB superfamily protein [Dyadobacter soli]
MSANSSSSETQSAEAMDRKQLLHDLDQTEQDFYAVLAALQPAQVNTVPFEGSWTAGQVAEHILMSESGIPETLLGSTGETDRPVAQFVPVIESIFLDFTAKYQSPEFIIPSDGPHDQQQLLEAFKAERAAIREVAANEDLSLTCNDFEFPQVAYLTRWEWLQFVLCHSIRHTRQLRNISEKVSAPTGR